MKINATAAPRKNSTVAYGNWSVDDFDSMEIRLGNKTAKFDGAGRFFIARCLADCRERLCYGESSVRLTSVYPDHTVLIFLK